jgi:hypothetical protein
VLAVYDPPEPEARRIQTVGGNLPERPAEGLPEGAGSVGAGFYGGAAGSNDTDVIQPVTGRVRLAAVPAIDQGVAEE